MQHGYYLLKCAVYLSYAYKFGTLFQAGTFLPETDHEKYDFFDIDHYGEISLQPKVPMFPEDFSNQINGRQEWPLSWWGVESPPEDILAMQDDKTEVDLKSNQVLR